MSCFADVVTPAAPPDPTKHVHYTYGMVLGVDEFVQEFAYLAGHDHALARDLIGYGTFTGLRVTYSTAGGVPEVRVSEGAGVVPPGQLVRVAPDQCAKLNDWLAGHRAEVRKVVGSSPLSPLTAVRLAVVLRYHECLTDDVPVPGEPCRSADEAMAPSRVKDDFRLELRLVDPPDRDFPDQTEEDVLRLFAAALKAVPVDEGPGGVGLGAWEQALHAWTPTGPGLVGVSIPRDRATEYYRAAFRAWATHLRPRFARPAGDPAEPYLLLAELVVPLTSDLKVSDLTPVEVREERRPVLLHLRLIQELLGLSAGPHGLMSPLGPSGPVAGNKVTVETAFGQGASPGFTIEYARADHTHGTPPDPIPEHKADKSAHTLAGDATGPVGKTVVAGLNGVPLDTAVAPQPGQILTVTAAGAGPQWAPATFGGDVSGRAEQLSVVGLQGAPVSKQGPVLDQVLRFMADPADGLMRWLPADLPAAPGLNLGGDVTGAVEANTVVRIQNVPVSTTGPADGQFLRFAADPADGQLRWLPSDLPAAPGVVLGGDVTGAADGNAISMLQGTPVSAAGPGDGQILRVATDEAGQRVWVAADLPAAPGVVLGGDVTGAAEANTVVRIQEIPVSKTDPTVGQVLRAVAGAGGKTVWAPATLPPPPPPNLDGVVRHPPQVVDSGGKQAPTLFEIVAAGTFRVDVNEKTSDVLAVAPVAEVFNRLQAAVDNRVSPRAILMRFDGFRPPEPRRQYIVKLTPVVGRVNQEQRVALPFIPYLIDFVGADGKLPDGFRVGIEMPGRLAADGQLQVEVSEYRLG